MLGSPVGPGNSAIPEQRHGGQSPRKVHSRLPGDWISQWVSGGHPFPQGMMKKLEHPPSLGGAILPASSVAAILETAGSSWSGTLPWVLHAVCSMSTDRVGGPPGWRRPALPRCGILVSLCRCVYKAVSAQSQRGEHQAVLLAALSLLCRGSGNFSSVSKRAGCQPEPAIPSAGHSCISWWNKGLWFHFLLFSLTQNH